MASRRAAATPPPPFPWAQVLAFGFGVLRLAPRDFWSMTPRELNAASEGIYGVGVSPIGKRALDRLMQMFPDETRNEKAR